MFLCFLALGCGEERVKTVYVDKPLASQTPELSEAEDDPLAHKIVSDFESYKRGEISVKEMTNRLFLSPNFDHASQVIAREHRKDVRTGLATGDQGLRFNALADRVRQMVLLRQKQGQKTNWVTLATSVALGGVVGSFANTAALELFKIPTTSLTANLLTREIIPVFLSTGLIGGTISGVSAYIGAQTYAFWGDPWAPPWRR